MIDEEIPPTLMTNSSISSSSRTNSECSELNVSELNNNVNLLDTCAFNSNVSESASKAIKYPRHANKVTKKPKKKYDHVQSKVKQYIINMKKEQMEHRRKQFELENKKKQELRETYRLLQIKNEDGVSDIQIKQADSSQSKDNCNDAPDNISETQCMIELLNVDIFNMRSNSENSNPKTPRLGRKKSSGRCTPTSLKKLIFSKNRALETPGLSPIGANTTCNSEDIAEVSLSRGAALQSCAKNLDSFLVKSGNESYESVAPLLRPSGTRGLGLSGKLKKLLCPGAECFHSHKLRGAMARFQNRNRVQPTAYRAPELLVSRASLVHDSNARDSGYNSGGTNGADWNHQARADLFKEMEAMLDKLGNVTHTLRCQVQQLKDSSLVRRTEQ